MKRYFSAVVLLFFFFSNSHAQIRESYIQQTLYNDASHILGIGSGIITAPFQFDQNDWQKTIYTIAATSALFFIDRDVKQYAQSNKSSFNNNIFAIDDYLRSTTGLYAAAGLYSTGFIFKENKIREMGLHAIETIFLASSVTSLLKYSFGRARPYTGNDQLDFGAFRGAQEKYRAFPSGHTTGAFAFASVMAMSLENIYWKVFWYGSATMVGAARIYSNNHWLSDTFLAGIISYSVAHYVVNYGRHGNLDDDSFSIQIYPWHMGAGLRINF